MINLNEIFCVQMEVKPFEIAENLRTMRKYIDICANCGKEKFIIFPELCVTGYLLGDFWYNNDFCIETYKKGVEIGEYAAEKGLTIIFGNIAVSDKNIGRDGRFQRFNAVNVFYKNNGEIVHDFRYKTLLPNYRIFDDERYFTSGLYTDFPTTQAINLPDGVKIGAEICEDLWCRDYFDTINVDVTKKLLQQNVDIIVNISCSPWNEGKNQARNRRVAEVLGENNTTFVYCNTVGCQNNGKNIVAFDGDSGVYRGGNFFPLNAEPYCEFAANLGDVTSPNQQISETPATLEKQQINAICRGFQYIFELTHCETVVIGISGGIDSAVSAALTAKSIEKYESNVKIIGVNMPSEYNSEKSKNIAAKVAEKFCDEYRIIPISSIIQSVKDVIKIDKETLTEENLQARLRSTAVLMTIAQAENGIVINNGNKLETALGYATLYGDMCGAFAPLADLTKAEIFKLGKILGVPDSLIPDENFHFKVDDLPPTAELKSGQVDPMKFGYHDNLLFALRSYDGYSPEQILRDYIDGTFFKKINISPFLAEKYNLYNTKIFLEDLEWFLKKEQLSVFKRIQSPPIMLISRNSYGFDRRESQGKLFFSEEYFRLKNELLNNA